MNKTELAAEVAERLNGVDPDARHYVDAVFDVIMRRVAAGERVQILGFGTFDSVGRAARVGRNPRTGAEIQVAPSVSPRFHAGQTFRAQVTDGSPAPASASTASAVVANTEQDAGKPARAKKADAAVEKPTKTAAKKPVKAVATEKPTKAVATEKPAKAVAEKPTKKAKKKTTKPAEKTAPKSVKVAKKSGKAGKASKTPAKK